MLKHPIRRTAIAAITALLLALPCVASAQLARLQIRVQGLEPATGKVEVSLFAGAEDFMKNPLTQQTREVNGAWELEFTFSGLLDGAYGVVVVHDENDNDLYDAGFLGFGAEGLGYSNDAAPLLGRPSFEDVRFEVGTEDVEMVIQVE